MEETLEAYTLMHIKMVSLKLLAKIIKQKTQINFHAMISNNVEIVKDLLLLQEKREIVSQLHQENIKNGTLTSLEEFQEPRK